jgi:hypothetical protein
MSIEFALNLSRKETLCFSFSFFIEVLKYVFTTSCLVLLTAFAASDFFGICLLLMSDRNLFKSWCVNHRLICGNRVIKLSVFSLPIPGNIWSSEIFLYVVGKPDTFEFVGSSSVMMSYIVSDDSISYRVHLLLLLVG